MGMLDGLDLSGAPILAGLLTLPQSAGFPDLPKSQSPEDMWADIDRKTAEENAAADRRNAAGMTRLPIQQYTPFGAPDQTNPAVAMALGQGPQAFGSLAPVVGVPAPEQPSAPIAASPVASPAAAPQVPLPMPRPTSAPQDEDDAVLPPNATPTEGQQPANAPAVPETSLLGRIKQGLSDNSNLLLGLGAGFAGAPSFGTGMSRAFAQAIPGSQLDIQQAMQRGAIGPTYTALVKAGVPPQQALAAVYNPKILDAVVQSYITDRKMEVKTVKDALGQERLVGYNPYDLSKPPVNIGAIGSNGNGGITGSSIYAPGVSETDSSKTGDAYLAQFSPDVQAMAKAYINGDIMPTGNPRLKGIQTVAKQIAVKYGQDMGIPVSDTTYAEKRKLKTDLGSSTNSSLGGILANGESSFAHLAEAGKSMADLGNASHNFIGGGPIANAQNFIGNAMFPSSETQGKVAAVNQNLGRYGQESTKFYAGSGGGEAERMAALKEHNAKTASGEENAAFLEKEKSLMLDRLNGKFAQMRQVLGEDEANREISKHMPDIQKNIDSIDASIAKLRGTSVSGAPSAALRISSPTEAAKLPKGTRFVDPNGVERIVP